MTKKIKVRVIHRKKRKRFVLRWKDGERYAKASNRADAYREAVELEMTLNNPRGATYEWSKATRAYEEWNDEWSESNFSTWLSSKRKFERWCKGSPPRIDEINNIMLADFVSSISEGVGSKQTVRTYCRYLRGFFRWCAYQEWIAKAPEFKMPRKKKGQKLSRGRPLTGEEFDRMIAVIPKCFHKDPSKEANPEWVASWEFVCRGLWDSSLRLSEAIQLHWTRGPVVIDFPVIRFEDGDKGEHYGLPITREFWSLIKDGPQRGYVFRPLLSWGVTRSASTWGKRISRFGTAARIKVSTNAKGKVKYASAHDLRRSFMENWRGKVPADVLQILARHESLETTQRYYLGDEAQRVAEAIWSD